MRFKIVRTHTRSRVSLLVADLQTFAASGKSSKYFGYCRLHQSYSVQPAAPRVRQFPLHSTLADKCFIKTVLVVVVEYPRFSYHRVRMSNSDSYVGSKGSCESVHPSGSLSVRMQRSLRKMRKSIQKITGTIHLLFTLIAHLKRTVDNKSNTL